MNDERVVYIYSLGEADVGGPITSLDKTNSATYKLRSVMKTL